MRAERSSRASARGAPPGAPPQDAPSRAGRSERRPARSDSRAADDRAVYVKLTSRQVGKLLRETRGGETTSLPELLSGTVLRQDMRPFPYWEERYREDVKGGRFSLAALKALLVLAHLLDGEPVSVMALAKQLQMKPSATHRYLHTLVILGLAGQDPRTRKYRLTA